MPGTEAGCRRGQRAHPDRHQHDVERALPERLVEERRIAVDDAMCGLGGADVRDLEDPRLLTLGSRAGDRVLVRPVDHDDLCAFAGNRLATRGQGARWKEDAGSQPASRGGVRNRSPVIAGACRDHRERFRGVA